MPSEDTLFVVTQGCAVQVKSLDEEVINGLLAGRSKQVRFDGNGEISLHESYVSYACKAGDDSLAMTLGTWERLQPQLERPGRKVHVRDHPRRKPRKRDWPGKPRPGSPHADGEHGDLLRAIGNHRCGRAEVAAEGVPSLLVELCRSYAGYRILLVVNRRRLFESIKKYFKKHFVEEFDDVSESRYPAAPRRVALTPVAGLLPHVSRGNYDVVVLADLEDMLSLPFMTSPTFTESSEAACRVGEDLIRRYTEVDRVYGFTPVGCSVAACDLLTLDHLGGPLRYTPCPRKQAQVLLLPTQSGRTKQCGTDYLKRAANYWDNGQRNQQIAGLAKLLAQGGSRSGVRTPRQRIPCEQLRRHPGGSTAVLVENLTHANRLAKLLPGWSVVHAGTEESNPLNCPEHGGLIVTVARFARRRPEVENLLVASGEIPHGHLEREQFHSFTFVVDFLDEFDADATRQAEGRQQVYRERQAIVFVRPG